MKLSAPIYVLKSQAKDLIKSQNIPLNRALDIVAQQEGFGTWSLLMAKRHNILPQRYDEVLDYLNEGDLILIAARPGIGKTTFAYGLVAQAIIQDRTKSFMFSLVDVEAAAHGRLAAYIDRQDENLCFIDCSNDINAN